MSRFKTTRVSIKNYLSDTNKSTKNLYAIDKAKVESNHKRKMTIRDNSDRYNYNFSQFSKILKSIHPNLLLKQNLMLSSPEAPMGHVIWFMVPFFDKETGYKADHEFICSIGCSNSTDLPCESQRDKLRKDDELVYRGWKESLSITLGFLMQKGIRIDKNKLTKILTEV
jgi:hypothetical protein